MLSMILHLSHRCVVKRRPQAFLYLVVLFIALIVIFFLKKKRKEKKKVYLGSMMNANVLLDLLY